MIEVKIIAIEAPVDPWGSDLFYDREVINATASAKGYTVIDFFQNVDDLVAKIRPLIAAPNKCLHLLEIIGHGCPGRLDGMAEEGDLLTIWAESVAYWGRQLMTLAPLGAPRGWCEDDCSIYLSGCNTGLSHIPEDSSKSIAEMLADAMPFSQTSFLHHITVYGSKGYVSGTNMNGDEKTFSSYSSLLPDFGGVDAPAYKGSSDAKGNACWIPYKNW
jgi:hypothetical protein